MAADPMVRNRPSPEGALIGEQLARLAERELEVLRAKFPDHAEPCESCAFRSGTVPNRCLTTVLDAMKCVMEGVEFMCHQTPVTANGCHTEPCVGWLISQSAMVGRQPLETPWPFSHEDSAPMDAHQNNHVTPRNTSNADVSEVKRGSRN